MSSKYKYTIKTHFYNQLECEKKSGLKKKKKEIEHLNSAKVVKISDEKSKVESRKNEDK